MTQETAFAILKTGVNVFLTGEPGSGKTYTINRYVQYLRERGIRPAITASTGIAATHVGGMTVHSWSGIGIRKMLSKEDLEMFSKSKRLGSRLRRAHVLIIDEISMLDARTLDLVEAVCRAVKEDGRPWGGMQVIFVGDFFQLPPVSKEGEEPAQFSFLASAWQETAAVWCYLSEQYRQDDGRFLSMLGSIRRGVLTEEIHAVLASRKIESLPAHRDHIRLYAHNVNVDRVNLEKLNALPGKEVMIAMESRGPAEFVKKLKKGCLSPETLRLKVGARVMFTKNNFEEGFVNGTMGEIIGFAGGGAPRVRTKKGDIIEAAPMEWTMEDGPRTLAKIIQVPLRLAWAITVHKSQGMTLDSAVVDLSEAFEYGQGYVALSRVKTLQGLFLLGYNKRSLEVHPEVLAVDRDFRRQSETTDKHFSLISPEDRIKKEYAFVTACGGTIKDGKKEISPRKVVREALGTKESTYDKTLALWRGGKGLQDIADFRGISERTVFAHLEELFMRGFLTLDDLRQVASDELLQALPEIYSALRELGAAKLKPLFDKFNGKYSYNDLRLARILLPNE